MLSYPPAFIPRVLREITTIAALISCGLLAEIVEFWELFLADQTNLALTPPFPHQSPHVPPFLTIQFDSSNCFTVVFSGDSHIRLVSYHICLLVFSIFVANQIFILLIVIPLLVVVVAFAAARVRSLYLRTVRRLLFVIFVVVEQKLIN